MSDEVLLRISIVAQGKSPIFLIGLCIGSVVLGSVVAGISQAVGVPERISYLFPLAFIMGTVGWVFWTSMGDQGTISVSRERMIIEARASRPVEILIGASPGSLLVWKQSREASPAIVAGPLLRIDHSGGSVEIGTQRPELAAGLTEEKVMLLPPSYIVKPGDFEQLVERFGLSLPAAGR